MNDNLINVRCPLCNKLLCKIDKNKSISKEIYVYCPRCKIEHTLTKEESNNSNYFLNKSSNKN